MKTSHYSIKTGRSGSLEFLVGTISGPGLQTAILILEERTLAEDIVQAAFLKVAKKNWNNSCAISVPAWFLRMVVNDAIKAGQAQTRLVSLEELRRLCWPGCMIRPKNRRNWLRHLNCVKMSGMRLSSCAKAARCHYPAAIFWR